jgi:hypothetical protein
MEWLCGDRGCGGSIAQVVFQKRVDLSRKHVIYEWLATKLQCESWKLSFETPTPSICIDLITRLSSTAFLSDRQSLQLSRMSRRERLKPVGPSHNISNRQLHVLAYSSQANRTSDATKLHSCHCPVHVDLWVMLVINDRASSINPFS